MLDPTYAAVTLHVNASFHTCLAKGPYLQAFGMGAAVR